LSLSLAHHDTECCWWSSMCHVRLFVQRPLPPRNCFSSHRPDDVSPAETVSRRIWRASTATSCSAARVFWPVSLPTCTRHHTMGLCDDVVEQSTLWSERGGPECPPRSCYTVLYGKVGFSHLIMQPPSDVNGCVVDNFLFQYNDT